MIADQVEEAMLGGRSAFDEQRVDETVAARAKLTQKERNLRDKIAELASAATESRDELGLSPERLQRAVNTALELRQSAAASTGDDQARPEEHSVLTVPALDLGWARTKEQGLVHPVTLEERPITFDHELAAGQDDVALAHLGHPLVQKALATLRAEIWDDTNPRISRVSSAVVPNKLLPPRKERSWPMAGSSSLERPAVGCTRR